MAVDVNHGHLAAAAIAPDGNVLGVQATVPLDLAGLPASTRDGRLRAAITTLIAAAKTRGARAIVIENLNFAEARAEGRERAATALSRPAGPGLPAAGLRHPHRPVPRPPSPRWRATRAWRSSSSTLPTPPGGEPSTGYGPCGSITPKTTGHHAAAVVTGRRGLGHRARRRATGNQAAPEDAARPAQARTRTIPGRRDRTQETRHPTRPPAATRR